MNKAHDENRVYTIAGIHPLDGVFDIDNTTLYTRLQAMGKAQEMREAHMDISSDLSSKFPYGRSPGNERSSYQFIAYNTQADTLEEPYSISEVLK